MLSLHFCLNAHPLQAQAIQHYHEALKYDEAHKQSLLVLARLYLASEDLEACQQQCNALVRMDPNNTVCHPIVYCKECATSHIGCSLCDVSGDRRMQT